MTELVRIAPTAPTDLFIQPPFAQPAQLSGSSATPLTAQAAAIATMVKDALKAYSNNRPRSLQRTIGLSEIGSPCVQRLARKALCWDEPNGERDTMAADLGTAWHDTMEKVYTAKNKELGRERFLVEKRLKITSSLFGHSDLFDRDTGTVIDWKLVGESRIVHYRRHGVGSQYRVQAHAYGLGQMIAGEKVNTVADVFFSRTTARTDDLWVWAEPFQPQVAVKAIVRLENIKNLIMTADPEANPAMWALFPRTENLCAYCPFFLPGTTNPALGCPGPDENAIKTAVPAKPALAAS